MRDLLRFILLILFLPLIIVVLGPALVLAAVKGQQWLGPVTLDTSGYNVLGRAGVFLLGVAVWLLVWAALVWLTIQALTPVAAPTPVSLQTPVAATYVGSPTALARPATVTPAPTRTPVPVKPSATPPPTATATRVLPTNTPTPQLTGLTATHPVTDTPEPDVTSTPAVAAAATSAATPAKTGTLTPANRRAALAAVDEANQLLRDAIAQASDTNVENLGKIWQGKALDVIERFAIRLNDRYARPLNVAFEYVLPPEISEESRAGEVIVSTREKWSYGSSVKGSQEVLEFIYTLAPQGDGWVITRYTYRNLATPSRPPTATPTPTLEY